MPTGEKTITLTLRTKPGSTDPHPTANQDLVYRRAGVSSSVYITKRMFCQESPPHTLTLTSEADDFRLPDNLDPDATTKRIEMLQDREARKRDHAETELGQANELRTKAEALLATLDRIT